MPSAIGLRRSPRRPRGASVREWSVLPERLHRGGDVPHHPEATHPLEIPTDLRASGVEKIVEPATILDGDRDSGGSSGAIERRPGGLDPDQKGAALFIAGIRHQDQGLTPPWKMTRGMEQPGEDTKSPCSDPRTHEQSQFILTNCESSPSTDRSSSEISRARRRCHRNRSPAPHPRGPG